MKILEIVNIQRKPLARIIWQSPDQLTLEVLDSRFESKLQSLIETGKKDGFPYRSGRKVEENGQTVYIDEIFTVKPDNEKFLEAMAEVVSRSTFDSERVFGIIKIQGEVER